MAIRRAVLLIADIGGYTRYMNWNRLHLTHAQQTVALLLESVIDAGKGLKLAKLEGDAAFFWAPDGNANVLVGDRLSRMRQSLPAGQSVAQVRRPPGRSGGAKGETPRRASRRRRHPGAPNAQEHGARAGVRADDRCDCAVPRRADAPAVQTVDSRLRRPRRNVDPLHRPRHHSGSTGGSARAQFVR